MIKKLIFVLYTFVIVIIILAGVEFFCLKYNKKHYNTALPFLVDWQKLKAPVVDNRVVHQCNILDPHFGYTWNGQEHQRLVKLNVHEGKLKPIKFIPGFTYYGNPNDPHAIRIVTLGGSTTQGPFYFNNWSEILFKKLEEKKISSVIFNGGCAGYSSNTELLKLVRDGLSLNPDLVISYSGINDVHFFYSLPKHPMISPNQKKLMEFILLGRTDPKFMPNFIYTYRQRKISLEEGQAYRLIEGINYGPEIETTPGIQWTRNVRIMHAVCNEFGVQFFAFLQPTMGVGNYSYSIGERAYFDNYNNKSQKGKYDDWLLEFYNEARDGCRKSDNCFDLVSIFDGEKGLYTDTRHVNEKGNTIVAQEILSHIAGSLQSIINKKKLY